MAGHLGWDDLVQNVLSHTCWLAFLWSGHRTFIGHPGLSTPLSLQPKIQLKISPLTKAHNSENSRAQEDFPAFTSDSYFAFHAPPCASMLAHTACLHLSSASSQTKPTGSSEMSQSFMTLPLSQGLCYDPYF